MAIVNIVHLKILSIQLTRFQAAPITDAVSSIYPFYFHTLKKKHSIFIAQYFYTNL